MDLKQAINGAAQALNAAIDKFNMTETANEQDALWYEIQTVRARIDAIVKKTKEAMVC